MNYIKQISFKKKNEIFWFYSNSIQNLLGRIGKLTLCKVDVIEFQNESKRKIYTYLTRLANLMVTENWILQKKDFMFYFFTASWYSFISTKW